MAEKYYASLEAIAGQIMPTILATYSPLTKPLTDSIGSIPEQYVHIPEFILFFCTVFFLAVMFWRRLPYLNRDQKLALSSCTVSAYVERLHFQNCLPAHVSTTALFFKYTTLSITIITKIHSAGYIAYYAFLLATTSSKNGNHSS